MTSEHVLKVGIAPLEQFKARTMAIARGEYKPSPDEPKIWFSSPESLAQVLSERNQALLALITKRNQQEVSVDADVPEAFRATGEGGQRP
jgi:predicted transcriptional regulator